MQSLSYADTYSARILSLRIDTYHQKHRQRKVGVPVVRVRYYGRAGRNA